jgi:hypothetical protein
MSEVFFEIVQLGMAAGAERINELPGCWEYQVSDGWWIAVNGHREPKTCSKGAEVPPFHAYVEWCGFPAGIVGPRGGVIAAGEAANEDTLIGALRAKADMLRTAA